MWQDTPSPLISPLATSKKISSVNNSPGHLSKALTRKSLIPNITLTFSHPPCGPYTSCAAPQSFCPVGNFIQAKDIVDPHQLSIWLKLNGQLKQHSSTENMIYKIPELISYCSGIMTLEEGDLILTGTPAGVSSVSPGDEVEIGLEQKPQVGNSQSQILDQLKFTAIQRPDGLTYDQLKV